MSSSNSHPSSAANSPHAPEYTDAAEALTHLRKHAVSEMLDKEPDLNVAQILGTPGEKASAEEVLALKHVLQRSRDETAPPAARCTVLLSHVPDEAKELSHQTSIFGSLVSKLLSNFADSAGTAFSSGSKQVPLGAELRPREIKVQPKAAMTLEVHNERAARLHLVILNLQDEGGNTLYHPEKGVLSENSSLRLPYSADDRPGESTAVVLAFDRPLPPNEVLLKGPVEAWPDYGLVQLWGYTLVVR